MSKRPKKQEDFVAAFTRLMGRPPRAPLGVKPMERTKPKPLPWWDSGTEHVLGTADEQDDF